MTIDERAREWCNSIINRLDTSDLYRGYVQGAVEERAEFKEYLENTKVRLSTYFEEEISNGNDIAAALYSARVDTIRMIIEELFEED